MPLLEYPTYLDHIRRESARFRVVLAACDPAERVPACPDWNAADLLWHLTEVQRFWAGVVRFRPAEPGDERIVEEGSGDRPAAYDGLLALFDEESAALTDALAAAGPDEEAWHWSGDRRVGTTYRRQAHEALIHRLDAEQAAGVPVTPLDPALAADGVLEALDVMYGGEPPEDAPFEGAGGLVAVELSDTGDTLLVEPGRITAGRYEGPHLLVRPSGSPGASVRGSAADVDAWLWHRLPDSVLTTEGERLLLEAFEAAVSPPLD